MIMSPRPRAVSSARPRGRTRSAGRRWPEAARDHRTADPRPGALVEAGGRRLCGVSRLPTNIQAVKALRYHVTDLWRSALRRRSQKDGSTWARVSKLAEAFLPKPHILHPWPS